MKQCRLLKCKAGMPAPILGRIIATVALLAIAVPAQAASPTAAQPSVPVSPQDLYMGAIARLASIPQKPYLSYVMTHLYTRKGIQLGADTISVIERRPGRRSWNEVTDVTVQSPFGAVGAVSIGRHFLIPDAFLPYRNESAPQGVLPVLDEPKLLTIATVHSSLSYAINLVGDENLENCGPAIHLSLRPLRNSERFNIRDIWVRGSDYRLCKAAFTSRLYQDEGTGKSFPTINTVELDQNGLITSYSLFLQIHMIVGSYAETHVGVFSDISWSDDQPSYLFDYTARKARNANP